MDLRSAVVLVPFAQHLLPARRAWVQRGGWQPRVETTHTLSASLAPSPRADDGQLTLDVNTDRLNAARMLRSQSWVRKDPLAFDEAVAALVATAHALVKASAAVEPGSRAEHWRQGRELLASSTGPGATERALARLALEWAALAPARATDVLFSHAPAAWIAVQAGGEDPLTQRLLSSAPSLLIDCDEAAQASFAGQLSLAVCDGFEHEAECAAAQVLTHLQHGATPVVLVAQDRLLVRRVRALLERQHVSLLDETGWKLSTTRAAAQVMGLLLAASPAASTDLLLDWLKAGAWPQANAACVELEATCRREAWSRTAAINTHKLGPAAAALFANAMEVLRTLTVERRQSLSLWLRALQSALRGCGVWDLLVADEAGEQVLHLIEPSSWMGQAAQTLMTLDDFTAWVDGALEDASFIPTPPLEPASVVITPLARVMLRPFAAVVFPGADNQHLGASTTPQPLLSDAQAQALGVPTASQRREAEALAFAHAMSAAPVSLFHRRTEGGQPLALSALVERLALRLRRVGRALTPWVDSRLPHPIVAAPMSMPAPHAAALLPASLSASACEALRACPYRFHALHLLRLREADELDAEIEKRDYGTWLHAVLMSFHEQREQPGPPEAECAHLMAVAQQEKQAQALDDADFLPFEAGFVELAPRYIAWLHERDAQGATWWQGEQDREARPPEWKGMGLHGRIDRMDHVPGAIELIDYKTGSPGSLKDKVKQPLEDTQLAFYVALMQAEATVPLQASYLALGRKIESIEHPDVETSARALVQGLGHDLDRIRHGAGMPALGEGQVCDFCEARGLCRRDHWSAA
ncbi:MAG: PD-(D/E)XK nuclease family protein [Cytophagales bacterium]|nr:PD-(D/E)XK nuclease family protein [Rhizobacter sp.]